MLEQLRQFLQSQLEHNELFKGGLLLMVGGALLATMRAWPHRVWKFVKRQSMVVIDIPDRDRAFQWVNRWLAEHNYSKRWARLLTVRSERNDQDFDKPKIIFSPAPGTHWLWYRGRLMILSRDRQQMGQGADGTSRDPFREYFTIRLLGRKRDVALKLIYDAFELANPHTVDKITIHRAKHYGEWIVNSWVPKRPLDSVVLPPNVMEKLIEDIRTFRNSEAWYLNGGLPYRRGYLFYGPPGNGKTSAVMALATHFNLDIGLLNIKQSGMGDEDLVEALAESPKNTLILIEDIDCITKKRDSEANVTFSGLLNALDGLSASYGQIVFMTTNHRDQLDEALIRPGRCDVQTNFPSAVVSQKIRLFERFFPDSGLAGNFSERTPNNVSMAELQQHMMMYRYNPHAACVNAFSIKKAVDE